MVKQKLVEPITTALLYILCESEQVWTRPLCRTPALLLSSTQHTVLSSIMCNLPTPDLDLNPDPNPNPKY